MPFKFPLGIDVENETSCRQQMSANITKDFDPVGEARDVIDRVKNAANHVEPISNVKVDHVLLVEACARQFLSRNRQHSAGNV